MSKQLIQDMIKVDKREPVSKKIWYIEKKKPVEIENRFEENNNFRKENSEETEEDRWENYKKSRSIKDGGARYGLWVVAVISLLFLVFSFSFLFAGATITITPRSEELFLNENFSAVKDAGEEDLPFELVVLSGDESKSIQGGEEKEVSESAKGTAVIYNNYNGATQRLDINTRLEGSNGKIYKTKKQVSVPGMKDSLPGSVEVEIYAEKPGEEYNSAPLDFKIFGFKGTPKYSKFYARSKNEIKGGFIGKQRQVSEVEKETALTELKTLLESKLLKKAGEQIPSGYILFNNAAFFNVDEENANGVGEGNTVPVSVKGTLFGVLFEEKALTKKIMEKSFPGEEKSDVYVKNIRDLVFSITNDSPAPYQRNVLENIKNINFNLSGTSRAIWQVDREKLIDDVVNQKKQDFNQIMAGYPNITEVKLTLRPFWKRYLPEKKEDIKLIITSS
ncbi:hypothetical protein HZA26_03315 [Candidatus Nomurabacteria bacterium]|nr:hypothetical protein [Candidatus Nomurabacteria bacterium]